MSFVKYGTIIGFTQVTELPTTIGGYGITDAVPNSRTITINGTAFDLAANRTWTVGSVTSVALSVPTGLSISGSPITSSGTLAITLTSGYSIPTTASQTNWDTAYTNRITSLTTTGTSGAATLIGNVLNIPQYAGGGGGGTVTSVASGNGMNFTTITSSGSVTLGTPSSTTLSSTNAVTTTSHTHAFAPGGTVSQYISGAGTLITFPTLTNGTVTSVAALTLGTTGTDVSSTVANSTTTPVITLNIPDASATARGLMTTGIQAFAGSKTFNATVTLSAFGARFTETGSLSSPPVGIGQLYAKTDKKIWYKNSDGTDYDLTANSGGSVTSVAALTLGTTGTDLSSSVANGTTTPVITLNVPTASATNRGALSSADWTTFNSKQNALTNPVTGTGTINYIPKFTATGSTIGNSTLQTDASGNLGLGVTPSAWSTGYRALQIAVQGTAIFGNNTISQVGLVSNGFYNGTNWIYNNSDLAGQFIIDGNAHKWYTAPTGTAGNAITFTQAMTLFATGNLVIGTTTDDTANKLQVNGNSNINGTIIGTDQTFGGAYRTFAFGVNSNNYNRIFATTDATDGIYINAATGQGVNFRVNGGGSNVLSIASTGAATFSSTVLASSYYSNGVELITSDGSANYLKTGATLYIQNGSTTVATISNSGAATFSSSVTAKGDIFIWGGNASQSGQITANSAGGGLYIAATGTNQNIRLVPSGTGIVQSIGNFDVTGTGTFSSSVTAASFAVGSTANYNAMFYTAGVNPAYIQMGNGSTGAAAANGLLIGLDGSGNAYINQQSAFNLYLRTNSINALTLSSTGAATFSNTVSSPGFGINSTPATFGTSQTFARFLNTGGDFYIGLESSTTGGFFTGSSAYASVLYSNTAQEFIIGGIRRLQIAGTGAATFSSSVTATELFLSTSSGNVGNINSTNANGGYLTWQTSGTTIADIGTAQQIFGSGGNDTFGINARGARSLVFGTNNTSRFSIASTGAATFSGGSLRQNDSTNSYGYTITTTSATTTLATLFGGSSFAIQTAGSGTNQLLIASSGAATFSSSVTASNFIKSISADQSASRFTIENTGTNGKTVNLIAGNPNVDQTGFSIAYGETNFLRFDNTGAATFSSTLGINGVSDNIKSGQYTPTLTNVTNVSSSSSSNFTYTRIGKHITVYGTISITSTTINTTTQINISVPITNSVTLIGGVGVATTAGNTGYGVIQTLTSSTTDVKLMLYPTNVSNSTFISFTYMLNY